MGIETPADLAVFFDPAVFGVAFTYARPGSAPLALTGIKRAAHAEAAPVDGWPGVSTVAPLLTCSAADLPAGAGDGDTVTLDGRAYAVRDVQPDGSGLARLVLERL